MIENKAIREFFDAEAEAQKASWEATMSLPLKERIRKRKAIDNVTLEKNYCRESEEGNLILKVSFKRNLSDFKEGDCLFLHEDGDAEYAMEMADFLYNPNKLNVAFSRAKSKLIILANVKRMQELDADNYRHISRMLSSQRVTRV